MTTTGPCELPTIQPWLECGFLEAKTWESQAASSAGYGSRQLERARLVKALRRKGVRLARLAAVDLSFSVG
jgi:hypothetical protein